MSEQKATICYGCMRPKNSETPVCKYCGFHFSAYVQEMPVHYLKPGEILQGRYIVGKVLGSGGFGITYIGYDMTLQVRIAIKEYFPSEYALRNATGMTHDTNAVQMTRNNGVYEKGLEKFLNEARVLARFSRLDGIVSVTDFFYENNTGYLIMDYLPGQSLKEILRRQNNPMSYEEVLYLMNPVLEALEKVHEHGVIHRDISPDNLIMNENDRLTLIDFGAARDVSSQDGKSMTVVLKPGYAPMEQYMTKGKQGPWTDVYALCATMYYMSAHIVPEPSTDRVISDYVRNLNQLGMNVPSWYSDAIARGLAIRPEDRIQNIRELRQALAGTGSQIPDSVSEYDTGQNRRYSDGWGDENETIALDTGIDASPGNISFHGNQSGYRNHADGYSYNQNRNADISQGSEGHGILPVLLGGVVALAAIVCIIVMMNSRGVITIGKGDESSQKASSTVSDETDSPEIGMTEMDSSYVTYKSRNLDGISFYSKPGDAEPAGRVPEGKCVHVMGSKTVDGIEWNKIEYFDRTGWIENQYLRHYTGDKKYFYIHGNLSEDKVFVNSENIKLHTEGNQESAYAAYDIPYGTEFTVLEMKNGWVKVEYQGQQCWMDMYHGNYYTSDYWQVEICNAENTKSIHLRKNPDSSSKSLTDIPKGKVLHVTEFRNGWGKVTYNKKSGWIKLHYASPCTQSGLPFSEDTSGE